MSHHTQFDSGSFNQVQQVSVLYICKLVKLTHFFLRKKFLKYFLKKIHLLKFP